MTTPANPNACTYGSWQGIPSYTYHTCSYQHEGGQELYVATIIKCRQGYYLPSITRQTGYYGHTFIHYVTQFQRWWRGVGADIVVDGRLGPQTGALYRLYAGHTPY